MKITALEYFIALAEYQSVNKAAKALYVAQPSLSKALGNLEKELGVQLFFRDTKGLRLTKEGEKILPEAKQVVKYYHGWKALSKSDSLEEVEIYTQSAFAHFFLPNILLHFKKTHPNIKVKLNPVLNPGEYISRDTYRPVLCLAVCNDKLLTRFTEAQGAAPLKLLDGEYQCLLNSNNPLAEKENIILEELQDLYFTMAHFKGTTENDDFLYPLFHELFELIPVSRRMEAESLANVISLITKDPEVFTISYYPIIGHVDHEFQQRLVHLPIQGRSLKGSPYLFYARQAYELHPALRELIADIKDAAKGI